MDRKTTVHRALADPSRAQLLDCLRASERPLSVAELAQQLHLHANTVRAHLGVLEDIRMVVSSLEHDGRPGRPRRAFVAVPEQSEAEHTLLASALASSLEPLADGARIASEAGRGWGRVLVDRLEPGRAAEEDACVGRVATLLRRRGFAPRREPGAIVMQRCPFADLARAYPRVVCSFHEGLIDGALAELGAPVVLDGLEPWTTPSSCVAHLARRTT